MTTVKRGTLPTGMMEPERDVDAATSLNGLGPPSPPHKTSGLQFPLSSEFRGKCLYEVGKR